MGAASCCLTAARTLFARGYRDARRRFLELAPEASHYPSPARGPDDEALFCDVARFGSPDASALLVLVSATHGVEGYCGSACQLDWLASGRLRDLPADTAVVLIHAVNPYGFAWDRRVTEEGCDLNRNFIDFDAGLPANPGYVDLASWLVPPELEGPSFARAEEAIADYRRQHGEFAYQIARKSGQYTDPHGAFFGGFGPSHARRTLERIVAEDGIAERERVIIVDYHTGLGPYGYGELQCEQASGIDGYRRAVAAFGVSVTSPDLGTSSSVPLHGTMDELWERSLGDRHIYVCLEFGTYDQERGRRVLRQDHWLARYRPEWMNEERGREIRAQTRLHYFPDREEWNEMVIFRSRQITRQALDHLSGDDW